MIHARKDGTISSKEPKTEDQGATPTQRVTTVRTVHALDPRRATFVASSVGGTQAAVILSEAGSLPESGTLQYRRVSIGPQLQHVVTPVQVQGSSSTDNQIVTNPRCTVASAQDFAHILVASSSNSALHAVELQNSLVNVSASMPQQFQALGTISGGQRTTSGAVIAQPVSQAATMAPRIVLNSAGNAQDVYALRITAPTTLGGAQSQQIMVLDSSASLAPSTDVTKVHSYSLPSVAASSAGTMQKIVISAPGQPLQIASLQHKAPASLRAGIKRQLVTTTPIRTNVLTVNNADVMSHLSNVNKLLFGSMQYNGKASSIPSSPKPKRIKLEKTSVVNRDPAKRKRLLDHLSKKLQFLKIKYYQQQTEYFFLKNGGNLVDYITWRKKLPNTLLEYLKGNRFEQHDDAKVISEILSQSTAQSIGNPVLFSQVESSPKSIASSSHGVFRPSVPSRPSAVSPKKQIKHISKHNSLSSVYDSQIGSQEEIVERAKQEAYVMQRVSDLRKEGLWSLKRLPKVAESPRIKAHWDYLLEEMVWLATDFAQERKWKKAAAKKCARMITKYFQDKDMKAEKAEKEEQMRLKKIAGIMSREIKQFWNDIEKLAEHKQKVWLEEKRKKVLDVHLNFIVDQTEKYSSWLTQGLNQSTPTKQDPDSSGSESDVDEEVRLLQQESEMPFEDFLHSLPPELLCPEKREPKENSDDDDFKMSEESEEDDEGTLLEQEKEEKNVDHKEEIRELEAENEMSIDELRNKYSAAYASDFEMDTSEQMNDEREDSSNSSSDEFSEEEEDKSDLKTLATQEDDKSSDKNPTKDISDIAATAESFQPKGNTLSTTQVCTIVPFLLKHSLREYQHIGLDWLNAMYEKKLNGILADEMGLGKTIQTISVLAHLACEKGMWGPHLIVVPTSVMLNWEMELKKWCPAFKILTYYGTPKERKQKRVGWTKPNAFHVCITSYKLVVQDHQSFRRKRWQYLILDEAHHIKNFKSQRWQLLLNFQSSHRLLLTGTPLQNNLMELWSLMHFLMPNVFSSHKEFKEWFGVIEGGNDYNEGLIKRLHKVLRPFLLRRLKSEVEKQLPKKYEHVVMCRLSKRQRYLYDDFMSQTKTKETLATGNFMSVINILMQLRKVCNHPNMFEERPTVSPFLMEGIKFQTASLAYRALEYNPFKQNSLQSLNLLLSDLELSLTAFAAHRVKKFQVPPKLIVEIDTAPEPPPSCPSVKMRVNFCNSQGSSNPPPATTLARIPPTVTRLPSGAPNRLSATVQPQRLMVIPGQPRISSPSQSEQQYTLQLVSPGATSLGGLTLQLQPNRLGIQSLIGGRFVQTPTGQHFVIATIPNAEQPDASNTASSPTPKPITTTVTSAFLSNLNRTVNTSPATHNRPVGRVAPFNGHPSASEDTVNQNHIQPAKPPVVHSLTKPTPKLEPPPAQKTNSLFYLEPLIAARERERKNCLHLLAKINNCRCAACPIYGTDLVEAVSIMHCLRHPRKGDPWKGKGYVNCLNAIPSRENINYYWDSTTTLSSLIKKPEERVEDLLDIVNKFVFVIPAVTCPPIDLHVSHPSPSQWNEEQTREKRMGEYLAPRSAFLHPIVSNMKTQFPELRLIQYDCGKLQRLAHLLWELKSNHHRVLIFTQMTRMLDILEQFLNYHGHTYLRLDGNTKVEQRQALMERFNADKRVFCFILSTRSGGIGVNLTGADTVIFYDSDWNPTMDAQAQDRCHRIGQTRDVHIYRLISERTIEENILRKANQKRILGNLAIEGGNFTTAFFKTNTLHELFGIEVTSPKKIEEIPESTEEISQKDLEQALGKVEEESDHKAAQTASAEAVAEFAEFDESIPLDADSRDNEEKSQAEEELEKLIDKLSPIEKYALHFLESLQEPVGLEQLKLAEEEMEAQKKDWELGHLKALKEEEERRHQDSDDSPLFCGREASHQVFFSVNGQEEMPTWAPPTPPTHENDIYIDHTVGFWYESNVMHEARLPPIYIKKEAKRQKLDPILPLNRKQKVRKEETVSIPRSLFDRPSAALLKMRREVKMQKVKGMIGVKPLFNIKPPMLLNKPLVDTTHHRDRPEWIVQEDWAVLQVVQELQGVPLNLTVLLPAHTPNWDMASDGVHLISKHHRASKSCRIRYENVLVPREEGKILYDTNPKKQKKTKGIYKTKNNRPMKTSQLFVADNNTAYSGLTTDRQKMASEAVARRKSKERPTFPQPPKNNKPAAVLVENSIHYDSPLTPLQIASARAERINREKNKTPLVVAQASPAPTTVQSTELPRVTAAALIPHQTVIASFAQAQQLQQVNLGKSALQTGTLTSVSLAKSLASGIMVNTNTATAGTLANLTKALTQGGLATQGTTVSSAALAAALSTARVTTQVVATSTTQVQAPAVVSVGTVQLRTSTTAVPAPTVAVSQLTTAAASNPSRSMAQLQALRQTAILRHREQQTLKQQHLKRLQQTTGQPVAKMAIGTQPRQQVAMKQTAVAGRPITESEMAQLMKRQQQQKQAQLTTAQILAQAQLQPQQLATATLVKTVSAPASSLTIPVTMASVNINVSMPQGKASAVQTAKGTLINQQLRQFQLQQQLLNQARKGNKVATNLAQLAKVPGKAGATSLNTVQIVQHSPQVAGTKGLQTAMTVQQIQQAMKQAIPQNLPVVVTATPSLSGIQPQQPGLKAQTTTLPSTTLTTSGMLKQQQTTTLLQSAPVTLAVRPQQLQIQVATSATTLPTVSTTAQVVQAAIQAARQQQAAAAAGKASPYTMRLRNPPK